MKINNRAARRYLRQVRSLLPSGRVKRQLMEQISACVYSYLEQEPDADDAALQARFGAPEDIAAAHVESMGTSEILKKLKIHRRIMIAVIVGLLVALLVWVGSVTLISKDAHNSTHGYIDVDA